MVKYNNKNMTQVVILAPNPETYCPINLFTHLDLSLLHYLSSFWISFQFCFVFMQHACKRAL